MKNKLLYSGNFKRFVRMASFVALCVALYRLAKVIITGCDFYDYTEHCIIPKKFMLILYAIFVLFFIVLIFVPTYFFLFGFIAISYSFAIFIDQPKNDIGIFIFIIGILSLAIAGFFRKKGKIKSIIFSLIFISLLISEIRFGKNLFISSLTSKFFFFFTDIVVFVLSYYLSLGRFIFTTDKVLNLADFPDLTLRDIEWIKLILKETKYETIAKEYNLSEGTVKNNFHRIFKILNVSDRIHFMSVYSDAEVLDNSQVEKKFSTFVKEIFWTD